MTNSWRHIKFSWKKSRKGNYMSACIILLNLAQYEMISTDFVWKERTQLNMNMRRIRIQVCSSVIAWYRLETVCHQILPINRYHFCDKYILQMASFIIVPGPLFFLPFELMKRQGDIWHRYWLDWCHKFFSGMNVVHLIRSIMTASYEGQKRFAFNAILDTRQK